MRALQVLEALGARHGAPVEAALREAEPAHAGAEGTITGGGRGRDEDQAPGDAKGDNHEGFWHAVRAPG